MNNRGFTLIELLVVMAIIGILAAIAVSSYIGTQRAATRSEAYTNLDTLRLLEEDFFADNNCYQPLVAGACPAGPTTYANTAAIQAFLTRFQPGAGTNYTYQIIVQNGVGLPNPVPVLPNGAYDGTTAALANANTPCFRAIATGNAGTRVAGDVFAIDCNNNRNF